MPNLLKIGNSGIKITVNLYRKGWKCMSKEKWV